MTVAPPLRLTAGHDRITIRVREIRLDGILQAQVGSRWFHVRRLAAAVTDERACA